MSAIVLTFGSYEERFAPDIAALEQICFAEPWSLQAVKDFFAYPVNQAVIALADGQFAGYVTYTTVADEIQIANVAVQPLYRGKGVATDMLAALVSRAKSRGEVRITLEVRESNRAALGLYAKAGFVTVGRRRGFYRLPKEDALLLDFLLDKE